MTTCVAVSTLLPGTRNQRPWISVKSRSADSAVPPGSCAGLYCRVTATGDANMVPVGPKSYAVPPTSALVLVPVGSMAIEVRVAAVMGSVADLEAWCVQGSSCDGGVHPLNAADEDEACGCGGDQRDHAVHMSSFMTTPLGCETPR